MASIRTQPAGDAADSRQDQMDEVGAGDEEEREGDQDEDAGRPQVRLAHDQEQERDDDDRERDGPAQEAADAATRASPASARGRRPGPAWRPRRGAMSGRRAQAGCQRDEPLCDDADPGAGGTTDQQDQGHERQRHAHDAQVAVVEAHQEDHRGEAPAGRRATCGRHELEGVLAAARRTGSPRPSRPSGCRSPTGPRPRPG